MKSCFTNKQMDRSLSLSQVNIPSEYIFSFIKTSINKFLNKILPPPPYTPAVLPQQLAQSHSALPRDRSTATGLVWLPNIFDMQGRSASAPLCIFLFSIANADKNSHFLCRGENMPCPERKGLLSGDLAVAIRQPTAPKGGYQRS